MNAHNVSFIFTPVQVLSDGSRWVWTVTWLLCHLSSLKWIWGALGRRHWQSCGVKRPSPGETPRGVNVSWSTVIFCSVANDKGLPVWPPPPVFSKLFPMSLAKLVPDSHVTTSMILLSTFCNTLVSPSTFFFFFCSSGTHMFEVFCF